MKIKEVIEFFELTQIIFENEVIDIQKIKERNKDAYLVDFWAYSKQIIFFVENEVEEIEIYSGEELDITLPVNDKNLRLAVVYCKGE